MNYLKLSALITLILFAGCHKDEDDITVKKDEPYVMEDIQWVLEEGDGQKILERKLPVQSVINNSSALVYPNFNPLKNMEGSSHFQFELPEGLSLKPDSLSKLVSIPAHIDLLSDNYTHIGGGIKVPFQRAQSSFPFSAKFEESLQVNPKTKMDYQATLFLRKNTATFKAIFVQPETKDRIELTGKWTGVFYKSLESDVSLHEID